jgi:uncharacterized protein YxeA
MKTSTTLTSLPTITNWYNNKTNKVELKVRITNNNKTYSYIELTEQQKLVQDLNRAKAYLLNKIK